MSTKAEQFRYTQERSKPKRTKKAAKKKAKAKATLGPDNTSARAAKHAAVVLEDTKTGRPSRKSSRRSKNRQKNATALERNQIVKAVAPRTKASQAKAKAKKKAGARRGATK